MAFRLDTKKLQIGGSFISVIFNNSLVSKEQHDAYNNNKHKAQEMSKMTIKSKTETKDRSHIFRGSQCCLKKIYAENVKPQGTHVVINSGMLNYGIYAKD